MGILERYRPVLEDPAPLRMRIFHVLGARYALGQGFPLHVHRPGFVDLKGGREIEDRSPRLVRDDPSGAEGASVTDPIDLVLDPLAQEATDDVVVIDDHLDEEQFDLGFESVSS